MLPEAAAGYAFKYGVIHPNSPTTDTAKLGSLYKETLNDLTAQANKDKGTRNLFMKAIPWSEPGAKCNLFEEQCFYRDLSNAHAWRQGFRGTNI